MLDFKSHVLEYMISSRHGDVNFGAINSSLAKTCSLFFFLGCYLRQKPFLLAMARAATPVENADPKSVQWNNQDIKESENHRLTRHTGYFL